MEVEACECGIGVAGTDRVVIGHHRHINVVVSRFGEAERRGYGASLSSGSGAPSAAVLAQISGLSDKTIQRGRQELESGLKDTVAGHQRQGGGGRKKAKKKTQR